MVYGFRSGALLHTPYHGGIKEPGWWGWITLSQFRNAYLNMAFSKLAETINSKPNY
jgi:hypothetical protein